MSRPGVLAAATVLALLLAAAGAGVSVAAADGPARGDGPGPAALQTSDVETDAVVLGADVDEDGDAVWTVEYRIRLDDRNTTEAFESLQRDVENNSTTYRDQFAARMRTTVAAAEEATGREMAVSNVTVSTRVSTFGNRYGVVSYRFVWEGFARTDDDRLVVGDALAGFFLDEDTRLSVSWPESYEIRSVDPPADESGVNSVTWVGPTEFTSGQPRLVATPASPLPVSTTVATSLLLVLAVVVGGAWYARRGRHETTSADVGDAPEPASVPDDDATSTSAAAEGASGGAADGAADDRVDPVAGGESGGATRETDESGDDRPGGAETPPELLSPEERVMRLLHDRGGRMKQKTVTEELDWSAARTSQVVGGLRDEGKVESFRLGRENVLRLPGEDDEP